ncbi:MAG: hypothetical protein U0T83_00670 [Bacteriovoracaceae bacterium]
MKKLLIGTLTLVSLHVYAIKDSNFTYVPSASPYSYDEARNRCYRPSSTTGLPAGRPVGRVLNSTGPYIVVCGRIDENGELTYVPSASPFSYNEARNRCYRPSSTTGLPAGTPVGRELNSSGPYIVVCKRPVL